MFDTALQTHAPLQWLLMSLFPCTFVGLVRPLFVGTSLIKAVFLIVIVRCA